MIRTIKTAAIAAIALLFATGVSASPRAASKPAARLVILMVWDGLRPDSVTRDVTPNLYALSRKGVYFAHSHSIFPSLSMVNGAVLATDSMPGTNYVWGDSVHLAPFLPAAGHTPSSRELARARTEPIDLESSTTLNALAAKDALDGHLLGTASLGALLAQKHGMVAVVGKAGPSFLFGYRAGAASEKQPVLISDDLVRPQELMRKYHLIDYPGVLKMAPWDHPPFASRDTFFTRALSDHLLSAAGRALKHGRSALLILWLHNPDATQHRTALGSPQALRALHLCDHDLGYLLKSLKARSLMGRTDLFVLSDHGFATLKARVPLAKLLVAKGLKLANDSGDVIVVRNDGSDGIFLSPVFSLAGRRRRLQNIVAFVERQNWCGAVFSRPRPRTHPDDYRGELAGTFSEAALGLAGPRSPDLVISFRELPDESNAALSGPKAPAYVIEPGGIETVPNRSQSATQPMPGAVYADAPPFVTTGMGTHGALGERELHNFCLAIGPDFRRAYIDRLPTSNLDVARTVARLLGLEGQRGRVLTEAMAGGKPPGKPSHVKMRTVLKLHGERIVTQIATERLDGEDYVDGLSVRHIGHSR